MQNKLALNRMIIYTHDQKVAYDEKFHKGINIICGENSSGKSTITHFIFYVLGGYFNDWVKEAKKCSFVIAEVEMNNLIFTIRREINISQETNKGNPTEPIYIFWGNIETAESANISEWLKYGYNSYPDKKSFSNVFFESLDLPMVKSDNNITFHQILRLLYVDQDSPTSSLFFYEQFDTSFTRETISDLLLGVYSQSLYDKKQREIVASKEYDDAKKEIKVIKQFSNNELDLFPAHIKEKITNKELEIKNVEEELRLLRDNEKTVRLTKTTKLEFEKLNNIAIIQRNLVRSLETNIRELELEIEDSSQFIQALENKIKAIRNSIVTREFLSSFPLSYCPECLNPLTTKSESKCQLCKESVDGSNGINQAKKIEQELSFQIKESNGLLKERDRDLIELRAKYQGEKANMHQMQIQVNQALEDVKSIRDERIDTLFVYKGQMEGEILQFQTQLEHAELYQTLISKRDSLKKELELLEAQIKSLEAKQEETKAATNKQIETKGLYLLNNDLARQDDFIIAKEFHVDYRNNIAFISDKDAKYSASSNFYLKTSARYAIFFASLDLAFMRYPRFILCDNMEDKGIEEVRAQNFQKLLIEQLKLYDKNNYQMIYTTSYLPEDLKTSPMVVGTFYTKASRSLRNID